MLGAFPGGPGAQTAKEPHFPTDTRLSQPRSSASAQPGEPFFSLKNPGSLQFSLWALLQSISQ